VAWSRIIRLRFDDESGCSIDNLAVFGTFVRVNQIQELVDMKTRAGYVSDVATSSCGPTYFVDLSMILSSQRRQSRPWRSFPVSWPPRITYERDSAQPSKISLWCYSLSVDSIIDSHFTSKWDRESLSLGTGCPAVRLMLNFSSLVGRRACTVNVTIHSTTKLS